MLKKAGHTKANDGIFFMPFHQFLNKPYFKSTEVAIYKDFKSSNLYKISQTVQQLWITVTIPSKQVVYFTLESQNPRFKKNCPKQDTVQVNTYLFKGTTYPGEDNMLLPIGYMGGSFYHVTVGKPDWAMERGTYTILVANWQCQGDPPCAPFDYQFTVYQQGPGTVEVKY